MCFSTVSQERTVPVPVPGKRFRRFRFRVRFLQKRFRRFRFPVPVRFMFIPEKSWSKRKEAFGPQGAMMHSHTLSLTACAWRPLCEMPSFQGSRDGVGTPPRTGRWDAADFSADFVRIFA